MGLLLKVALAGACAFIVPAASDAAVVHVALTGYASERLFHATFSYDNQPTILSDGASSFHLLTPIVAGFDNYRRTYSYNLDHAESLTVRELNGQSTFTLEGSTRKDIASLFASITLNDPSGGETPPSYENTQFNSRFTYSQPDVLVFSQIYTFTSSISAVPEMSTWAMLIVGFGVAGYALRRRAQVPAQPAVS